MPVSTPGPGWCPETSDGHHSNDWYDGGTCKACQQSGPAPDDYLWPDQSGPLFPAAVPELLDDDALQLEMAREDGDWDTCEPTL